MRTTDQTALEGKVVAVTGGSRGLGKAMVEAFAAHGSSLVIASRKVANCVSLAESVRARYGTRALPVECNVSDWAQCDALVDAAYAEFGRVDVLVNNAGLSPLYTSLDEVSESLFDKVIGVNLKGPFRLSSVIGTRMAQGDGGSIINITSIEAIRPSPRSLPYAAAKAALNTLTEGLARAFGPTVRANAIQCGPFLTDISAAWTSQMRKEFETGRALGRCGEADEIVGAALYFASEASSFCTGAVLRLDGGAP
jgi:NAD(P)-dependent dehydrogenase (short-subunit alcohol dehydrogenase family)